MAEAPVKAAGGGATGALAAFAANLQFDDLPPVVLSTLKGMVLDTLGATLAANTLGVGCRELLAVARAAGGAPESTIIGLGHKVPAATAALVNGGMAHALNYDSGGGAGHLGLIVPAPLAVAERLGGVNGREFLTSLAAGVELCTRLAVAIRSGGGGARGLALDGQVLGYFGAAASAGRLLGLDAHRMHSALGLAMMQASGTMQVVLDGDPPAKAIYAAFCNHGGVLSALLAQEGLGAECNALEGAAGLFALFYDGKYDPSVLQDGLGDTYLLPRVSFKPWPTSGHVHPFIEAALELVERHQLRGDDVAEAELRGSPEVQAWFEPIAERRKPQNVATAGNSIFFGVAKALANGRVTLSDYSPDGLRQAEALQIAERMTYAIDPQLTRTGVVQVRTTAGAVYESRVDTPLGHPTKPMSYPQLVAKFRDCAQYSDHPIPDVKLNQVIDAIEHLDHLPDVRLLPALVSGG